MYGSLQSDGCGLLTISSGIYACFPGPVYSESVTGFVYTDPFGRKFEIAATGELRSITDLNDNVLTFTPDGITSTTGMVVPFVRDEQGRITQITDPEGNVFLYGYDTEGDLDTVTLPETTLPIDYDYYEGHFFKSAVDPRGNQAVLTTYDEDNRLLTVTDAESNQTTYSYDIETRKTYVGYQDTGIATFEYDEHGYLVEYLSPEYNRTTYTYNENHDLLSVTNPELETISYTYNEDGHRTGVYDPDGNPLITAEYNEYGGPTTLTTWIDGVSNTRTIFYDPETYMPLYAEDGLGTLGSYTWDDNGSPLTFTNANGEVTTYTYNDYGYVLTETNAELETITYTYDEFGRVLTREAALDRITYYEYDALGRLETVTDPEGGEINYVYDPNGNVTTMIDQVGNQTNYVYDANNRLTQIINPLDNSFSQFFYDHRGSLTREVDPDGFDACYVYDKEGRLTTYQADCDQPTVATIYAYDGVGRLIDLTDPTGVATHYDYDNMGRVTDVTTAYGTGLAGTTHYEYDDIGQLISMTDPNLHTTTYEYDIRGRRWKTTYPDSAFIEQEYDDVGRLLVYHDELGIETRYDYDDVGRLISTEVVSADGLTIVSTTSTDYDEVGRRYETTDANGMVTRYDYDDNYSDDQWKVTVTAAYGLPEAVQIAEYVYDLAGQLTQVTDARGYVTGYTYNEHGQLIQTDYQDTTSTTQTYTDGGRPLISVDQAGVQTVYAYDSVGRLFTVQVIESDGLTELSYIQYEYDDAGRRELVTQQLNELDSTQTFYQYDLAGRLWKIHEGYGAVDLVTEYTYNTAGQLETVTDPRGSVTTYEYNNRGWHDKTIFPGGAYYGEIYTQQQYYPDGQLDTFRDENGYLTDYDYDVVGRLQTITNPESEEVEYAYNAAGQVTAVIDAESHQTDFTYDIFGRLETKTWADGLTVETFGYDDAGNLTSHEWADGVDTDTNTFVYNEMNRLWEAHYFDGLDVVLSYTDTGQVETVTLDGGTPTTYTYNGLGLPTQVDYPNGDLITYDYDLGGRRTEMTLPGSITIGYDYDEANRLIEITNSTLPGAISFGYDGRLLDHITYPNNLNEYYDYNKRGQLTDVFQGTAPETPVEEYHYTLGDAGERLYVTMQDGSHIDWAYDQAYRLTSEQIFPAGASTPAYQVDYTYDDAGNRITETLNETDTTTYTYNDLDQLTHVDLPGAATDIDYSYDLHGNLEQITQGTDITLFEYNGLERLDNVTLPDSTTIAYTYDAAGRRLSQTVNSTDTTTYLWDEFSRYGDVVQTSTAAGDTTYTTGLGMVLAQSTATDDLYLYHDGQGSTRALADDTGTVVDSFTYTAFGELYGYTGTPQTDFLYTGQQFDDLTGLYNLRARMYDPGVGRFLSMDSAPLQLGNPVEWNRYVYAASNPVNYYDPSGYTMMEYGGSNVESAEGSTAVGTVTGSAVNGWVLELLKALALSGGVAYIIDFWQQTNQNMQNGMNFWDAVAGDNHDWGRTLFRTYEAMLMAAIGFGFGAAIGGMGITGLGALALEGIADVAVGMAWDLSVYGGTFGQSFEGNLVSFLIGEAIGYGLGKADVGIRNARAKANVDDLIDLNLRQLDDEFNSGLWDRPNMLRGNCSFSEDTLVETDEGAISIGEVELGDYVLAYDEATGEIGYYPVTAIWSHDDEVTVNLIIDGETIETTLEHPFYTDDEEWIPAGELNVGDEIYQSDGSTGTVESLVFIVDSQEMYNLTVDEAHTYFVGEGQWLVHNACPEVKEHTKLLDRLMAQRIDRRTGRECQFCAVQRGTDPRYKVKENEDPIWRGILVIDKDHVIFGEGPDMEHMTIFDPSNVGEAHGIDPNSDKGYSLADYKKETGFSGERYATTNEIQDWFGSWISGGGETNLDNLDDLNDLDALFDLGDMDDWDY